MIPVPTAVLPYALAIPLRLPMASLTSLLEDATAFALYPLLFPGMSALSLDPHIYLGLLVHQGYYKWLLQMSINVVMFAWHSTDPTLPIVIKSSK